MPPCFNTTHLPHLILLKVTILSKIENMEEHLKAFNDYYVYYKYGKSMCSKCNKNILMHEHCFCIEEGLLEWEYITKVCCTLAKGDQGLC